VKSVSALASTGALVSELDPLVDAEDVDSSSALVSESCAESRFSCASLTASEAEVVSSVASSCPLRT
jgi:hypothetical protein